MGAQDRESYNSDVEMGDGEAHVVTPSDPQASPDTKAKQQDTGQRHRLKPSTDDSLTPESDPRALRQNAPSDNSAGSAPDSLIPSPSNQSTAATSLNTDCFAVPPSATSVPTLDEQVAKVTQIGLKEPEEGDKGYLISTKWLVRVQARSVFASDLVNPPKSATEGEIGPVDNSDLAMVIEDSGKLLDEAGEPYVPLRPGLSQGEDYHILPQEAWDLIISWYGLAKDSPILTRYAHDSQADGAEVSNVIYELMPPIFSFLKVPSEHTSQTQREKDLTPQRLLASKKKPFMQWLKEGKELLQIDLNTKVRVWRILGGLKNSAGSGVLTPAVSRSASPAPGAEIVASAGDRMLLDVNTFASLLIGEHRELLEIQDQTGNPKYNGSLSLGTAGLGRDEVICLEEQKSGKEEWPSESSKLTIKGLKTTAKTLTASGRTSPAPGMVTRGRQKQAGRPRGITGLSNLGNTCYMNSALQCIRSVKELTDYFLLDEWKKDLNIANVLGHRGEVARAYATLLHQINDENSSSTNPVKFKAVIGRHGPSFSGYQQQDSQEFLLFLLDGLQEDLNRVLKKPYVEKPDSTDEMVRNPAALKEFADKNWEIYKARNDSVVTDLFAGMYKSTLTCPVCDKVSIIFDPFNNLTLQLPVENNWSKEVLFFPLHKRPFRIDVDVDKHSSITALKEFVAQRTGADVQRLLVAESYKNKIYKIFDNNTVISEANIQPADIICVYELNAVPTNYNPNKVKKYSIYTIGRDTEDDLVEDDSPDADALLVPMYNRLIKNPGRGFSKPFFGQPTYLVLNREDRASLDGVLKKVFGNVLGMTTTNLLSAEIASDDTVTTPEGSDTVLMADDISSSDSNTTTAASVQGEDGLVDVSMRDASQAPETSSQSPSSTSDWFHRPGTKVPQSLKNLFTLHVASTGEGIPTGWNLITESVEYDNIEARIPKSVAHRPARAHGSLTAANGDSGSSTSEDELAGDVEHDENVASSDETSSESAGSPMPVDQDSDNELTVHRLSKTRNPKSKRGKRQRNKGNFNKKRTQRRTPPPPPQPQPKAGGKGLIRPGEAIVLDWNAEAFDSLFGGSERSTDDAGDFQGAPTWKSVELYPDAELVAKRSQRNSRKKNGISLDDCLAEFGKAETLSEQNAWYCPRCKEHRRADKTYELWKVPDILVMHLKRFSSNRNFRDKLEVKVEYPTEGLDLNGMVRDREEGQSLIYDLIAVDNHYGGLGGGHYTAYAKNSVNNNWYEYNGKWIDLIMCSSFTHLSRLPRLSTFR